MERGKIEQGINKNGKEDEAKESRVVAAVMGGFLLGILAVGATAGNALAQPPGGRENGTPFSLTCRP